MELEPITASMIVMDVLQSCQTSLPAVVYALSLVQLSHWTLLPVQNSTLVNLMDDLWKRLCECSTKVSHNFFSLTSFERLEYCM